MALIGSIAISMQANTQKFVKGLNVASKSLNDFASNAASGLKTVGLFGGALALAGGYAMTKMIGKASDLSENVNKLEAIFGKDSQSIIDQADLMATAFGTSKIEFTDAAARMGGLLKGAGYSATDASKLSVAMVKLANDSSSFFNTDFDTAFNKIRSGLAGEAEPLRDFGVMLSEDSVKAYAYAHGIAKLGAELSIGAKTQARLALITQGLSDAQGDAAKTADGVANSTRGLWGRLENLATMLGQTLLPIAESVLGQMQVGTMALTALWEANSATVADWGKTTVGAIGASTQGMGFLQKTVGFVGDTFHYLKIVWLSVVKDVLAGTAKIVEGLGKLMWIINPTSAVMKQLGFKAGMDFAGIADQIKGLADTWQDSFVAEMAAPLPSDKVNQFFDDAQKRIADARRELAKPGIDVTKFAPASAAATAKMGETKFASANDKYSKEAANMVLRSQYGSSVARGDAAETTAKATTRSAATLEKIDAGIKALAGQAAGKLAGGAFNAASAVGGWF